MSDPTLIEPVPTSDIEAALLDHYLDQRQPPSPGAIGSVDNG